jgi:signal transduction histidine kinase
LQTRLEAALQERDQLITERQWLAAKQTDSFSNSQTLDMIGRANLFDFAPVGYVATDAKGRIHEFNHTAVSFLGQEGCFLKGRFLTNFVVKEDVPKLLKYLRRCQGGQAINNTELRLKHAASSPRTVELVTLRYFPPNSLTSGQYRTAIIDSSHHWELERTQQDYRSLIDSIQGLVWEGRTNSSGWVFSYVSPQAEQLLGYPAHRWLMEPDFWEQHIHPDDRRRTCGDRAHALNQGRNHVLEYRMTDAHRHPIWVRDSVSLQKEENRLRLRGIIVNLTELKEKDALLRRAHDELEARVQERTGELARVCADLQREMGERKRLERELLELTDAGRRQAMDVHGEVGQRLAGIGFMLKGLGTKLEKTAPSEAGQAERIHALVDQTMAEAHDPASDLIAAKNEETTLPQALKALASQTTTLFQVSCHFEIKGRIPALDPNVFNQLYSIAMEAVVNGIRYAAASEVVVSLDCESGRLSLTVRGNGHSFPTPWHPSLELGVKLMSYRARLIGARFHIKQLANNFPVVVCRFPILAARNGGGRTGTVRRAARRPATKSA